MQRRLIFFLFIALSLFFVSSEVHAIDQRCFTKSECIEAREQFGIPTKDAEKGFVGPDTETIEACGGSFVDDPSDPSKREELGFCLPAGAAETKISIGGNNRFNNIAEYISFMYEYGLVVASVIAVLVVIISGLQWTTSGGNSATIDSAKKRIGSAIMGLILLALAYTILNTVNPRTVALRLPQIWLINEAELAPVWCSQTEKDIAHLKKEEEDLNPTELDARVKGAVFVKNEPGRTPCGNTYLVRGSGTLTCSGDFCAPIGGKPYVCAPKEDTPTQHECVRGSVVINIFKGGLSAGISLLSEEWAWPFVDPGETEIWGVCLNGNIFELPATDRTTTNQADRKQTSILTINNPSNITAKVKSECGGTDISKFKGFVFNLEMQEADEVIPIDEDHLIGRDGVDLGDRSAFEDTKQTANIKHFYTLSEMEKGGIVFSLDVSKVYDIDTLNPLLGGATGDEARKKFYSGLSK